MNASYKHLSGAGRIDIAVDDFELQVRIVLKQIYLVVHVRGGPTGSIQDRAPLDMEDLASRAALDRGEDSTARAVVAATITRGIIGALVCPQRKDGIGIRTKNSVCCWETHADPIGIMGSRAYKVEAPIGVDVNTIIGLIV